MKGSNDKLEVYLAHRAALVDYATPIVGSRAAAEDIVQDAWLRFVRGGGVSERPGAYLYRVVRNLALDLTRRMALEYRCQTHEPPTWLTPVPLPRPDRVCCDQEQLDLVSRALAELPLPSRRALEMYRLAGMTLAEIAEELGVSISSAHRLIQRAMVSVALYLDETNGPADGYSDATTDAPSNT